ncbi:hypothetical protein HanRHA438_Chr05g0243951 [Helianthus annuus]|nr:hypothetical protein HanRHA438_Chr05g0243951 [Helianthus annuus]
MFIFLHISCLFLHHFIHIIGYQRLGLLYWKVCGELQRERMDNRALTRCVQELRMKGVSFDLSKEPAIGNRMKSSSVEIKWKPLTWCKHYLVTLCFVGVMGLAVPVCRFMACV